MERSLAYRRDQARRAANPQRDPDGAWYGNLLDAHADAERRLAALLAGADPLCQPLVMPNFDYFDPNYPATSRSCSRWSTSAAASSRIGPSWFPKICRSLAKRSPRPRAASAPSPWGKPSIGPASPPSSRPDRTAHPKKTRRPPRCASVRNTYAPVSARRFGSLYTYSPPNASLLPYSCPGPKWSICSLPAHAPKAQNQNSGTGPR
jgi:hypothetical protein